MDFILRILFHMCLFAGFQCGHQVSWLPCHFIDEKVILNSKGTAEGLHTPRDALLQFGQKGDTPVNPHALTFLITGSKLDMRQYLEDAEAKQMECELRRYSTQGIHVRWPVKADKEYNDWFTCTLKHTKDLFTVTGILRRPTDQFQPDHSYTKWTDIKDREILTTTVVMLAKTRPPSMKAGLGSKQKLHCEFAVDHKEPHFTVEWHRQLHGEREKIFSHNSRTGQTDGSGVEVRSLAGGDASLTIPSAKMSSEGNYACSVAVTPLSIKMDLSLSIEVAPRVSLNIGPTLLLQSGETEKIVIDAERFYPLDVNVECYHHDPFSSEWRAGAPLPKVPVNIVWSSHKPNQDKTYSVSAFFYIEALLRDSGRRYTCNVSHRSLRKPITKSFNLAVEESSNWMFYLTVVLTVFILLYFLKQMLPHMRRVRRQCLPELPY